MQIAVSMALNRAGLLIFNKNLVQLMKQRERTSKRQTTETG